MDDISRIVRYNSLLSIYGDLLSNRQKDILEQYYNFNLSISEIAESNDISRAAVEDAIQKGIKKLDEYESVLGIYKSKNEVRNLVEQAEKSQDANELRKYLEEIKKVIDNGIWIING